jgi:hypothetical protein
MGVRLRGAPPASEVSEFRQFLLSWQAKLKPWRGDGEAVLGPQFDKHGLDLDNQDPRRATRLATTALSSARPDAGTRDPVTLRNERFAA